MTERLGEYILDRHVATGGMAEIFLGRRADAASDEEIALKCILPHLAREERFITMFLDEARIAARLQHPNIVEIYELGEEDGEYFIAMEYIDGGDLADLLDRAEERNVEIPIAMSIRIIADILSALDYAHDYEEDGKPLQIVHRDVTPHNVLIGRDGKIKLVDFGIAHAVERHAKTETGLVKGKLSYMSPEQVEQRGLDRRADIFSAGALLYELLVGEPPFGRELAAVNSILNDPTPNPQVLRPDVPDELVEVLTRSMEKDPDQRYGRARDMLDALEDVLAAFDKQVHPTEVAAFAAALINGDEIAYYEDVSQAIPRSVAISAERWNTEVDAKPASRSDADTLPRANELTPSLPPTLTVTANSASVQPSPARYFAVAAVLMVGLGGAVAVIGMTSSADDQPQDPVAGEVAEVAQQPEPDVAVIELGEQVVEDVEDDLVEDGFTFDEDELELIQLEQWVDTLDAEQLDVMLAANFGVEDGEILWSVRGPLLAQEIFGPPEPINPGDPAAAKRLGLEELDTTIVAQKKRSPKKRKRPRVHKRSQPKPRPVAAKKTEPKPVIKPKPKPKPKPTETARKKKNDLQIIDRAVPY